MHIFSLPNYWFFFLDAIASTDSRYGKPNKTVHLGNVACDGSEYTLDQCDALYIPPDEGKEVYKYIDVAGIACKISESLRKSTSYEQPSSLTSSDQSQVPSSVIPIEEKTVVERIQESSTIAILAVFVILLLIAVVIIVRYMYIYTHVHTSTHTHAWYNDAAVIQHTNLNYLM